MSYHNLLQRQIKKHLGSVTIPKEYHDFLNAINDTYLHHEKEHGLLEQAMDLSSIELEEQNTAVKNESILLKLAQKEIETLFENIEEVYFTIDLKKLKIIQISSFCEKLFGYKPVEFINDINLWFKAIHPDDKAMYDKNIANAKQEVFSYRIIHENKSIKWVKTKIIPTLDKRGQLVRLDGLLWDITSQIEYEERISLTERYLTEAQLLGKTGNWNFDMVTNQLFFSQGLRHLTGIDSSADLLSFDFMKMVHEDDRQNFETAINSARETGKESEITYRNIRLNDGEERIFHSYILGEKGPDGSVKRIYAKVQDITERRIAELKLEKLHLNMYQISHDLRGPLNSAKNYLYLALKRVNDQAALDYFNKINDSYSRMEHRILSLLDLQRINRAEINLEKINLSELVEDIIATISGLKGFNEITIKRNIHVVDSFLSDKQFLHSIIHNLVSNAFTHRQKKQNDTIVISANEENDYLNIQISDNGMGIPDSMKGKIFEKFAKGDKSINGTGLGLFIVKNLVTKLNGEIDFESEYGKGTAFTIKLPYKPDVYKSIELA